MTIDDDDDDDIIFEEAQINKLSQFFFVLRKLRFFESILPSIID